ncbi:MAG: hypothetical protein ABIK67_01400 [candidate division WOR-3 bacterium]
MKKINLTILLLNIFTFIQLSGQESLLDTRGYVEVRNFLRFADSVNFDGYGRGWLEFKTNYDYYGAQIVFDGLLPFDTMRNIGLNPGLTITRLAVWFGPENIRVIAGKQKISWGVTRVFRPLDIFNPTNLFEPGYERFGINAILLNLALSSLTNTRFLFLPQFPLKSSGLACRFGSNLLKNDIGVNAYYQSAKKHLIFGTDLAGELIFGYWGELTYNREDTTQYFKASVGIDYTFPLSIYGMVEYFYDQSGKTNPAHYDWQRLKTRGTLACNYLYIALSSMPNLIFRPALNSVFNLNDRGFILIPQIAYEPWANTLLNLGLAFTIGSATSEFKKSTGFNEMVFLWAKVYF